MQASNPTGGATPVTIYPEAGREEQLSRWGLEENEPVALRQYVDEWGTDDERSYAPHQSASSRTGFAPEAVDFLRMGGWSVVSSRGGNYEGGVTAHRGVLHPDEYVDRIELRVLVEQELGLTFEEIQSVYRQGPLSDEQRALRDRIDARLLEVSNAGGNMLLLAKEIGWAVEGATPTGGERCKTMERAVERARVEGDRGAE
jgi:hypothetical protein